MVYRLATNQRRGQLNFAFVCDCENYEAALQVAKTLGRLPVVARAAIRFGPSQRAEDLAILAQEVANWMIWRTVPAGPCSFPKFLELPRELQQRIIDKATFKWNQDINLDVPWQDTDRDHPWRSLRTPRMEGPRECCYQCSPAPELCFCPTRSAAWSASCTCPPRLWSPRSLFMSSDQVRTVALEQLFTYSRASVYISSPNEALSKLRSMPCAALRLLQGLQLHFPAQCLLSPDWAIAWDQLLKFLQEDYNLRKLEAQLHHVPWAHSVWSCKKMKSSDWLTRPSFEDYSKFLVSLHHLEGLRQLSVRLDCHRYLEVLTERAILGRSTESYQQSFSTNRHWDLSNGATWPDDPWSRGPCNGLWTISLENIKAHAARVLAQDNSESARNVFSPCLEGIMPDCVSARFQVSGLDKYVVGSKDQL